MSFLFLAHPVYWSKSHDLNPRRPKHKKIADKNYFS